MAQRLSQETVEALIKGTPAVRLSQETVEAIMAGAPSVRLSQLTVEALIPSALVTVTRTPRIPAVNHQNLGVV